MPREHIPIEIGTRFGKLVVVDKPIKVTGTHSPYRYPCDCDCGKKNHFVDANNLRGGRVKSCGCELIKATIKRSTTHGKSKTKAYRTWCAARGRCHNPNHQAFRYYGGQGITMCAEWYHSFEAFYADMGEPPSPEHSIDRIDYTKGYTPDNCRWADKATQAKNRKHYRKKPIIKHVNVPPKPHD